MAEYRRPIPIPDEDPWTSGKDQTSRAVIKRCNDCGFYIHLPKQRCPKCWSTNVGNSVVSGKARLYRDASSASRPLPGHAAVQRFNRRSRRAAGLRIMSNVIGISRRGSHDRLPVEVTFEDVIIEAITRCPFRFFSTSRRLGSN